MEDVRAFEIDEECLGKIQASSPTVDLQKSEVPKVKPSSTVGMPQSSPGINEGMPRLGLGGFARL